VSDRGLDGRMRSRRSPSGSTLDMTRLEQREDDRVRAFEEWDLRTAALLEGAYVAAGAGPGGSGSTDRSEGEWRAKRQHLAVPMDADGTWLDVGCANGHLLVTLPRWASERGVTIAPHGLEVLPRVADLARALHPGLAPAIWTGSVMSWTPPTRFGYVTALDDAVPDDHLGALVNRLLEEFVAPGGRLIVSSYTDADRSPRQLFEDLAAVGHPPHGVIRIDRPHRHPLLTAWIDT
jgi:hypothetical protein